MTSKQSLFLVHQTSLKSLISILKRKKLLTSGDLEKFTGDRFDGIYFFLGSTGKSIQYASEVALIFSAGLLKRQDYHINRKESRGLITKDTVSSQVLHSQEEVTLRPEEIVFHNEVSLTHCLAILVEDQKTFELVKALLPKIPVLKTKVFPELDFKIIQVRKKYKPNFIFFPKPGKQVFTNVKQVLFWDDHSFDPDIWIGMLLNCDYVRALSTHVDAFVNDYIEGKYLKKGVNFNQNFLLQVYEDIKKNYLEQFVIFNEYPTPVVFPPFKRQELLKLLSTS